MILGLFESNHLMSLALEEAVKAAAMGEVPVGAVLVLPRPDGLKIVARAHNLVESFKDATAHAEALVLRGAAASSDSWRLSGAILVTTLEPCTMCLGAAKLSRVATIVYGAKDAKAGACGSIYDLSSTFGSQSAVKVIGGVREDECKSLLTSFFKELRRQKKEKSEGVAVVPEIQT